MHVHVRVKQQRATRWQRGSYSCRYCKHWQPAEVQGIGAGTETLLGGEDGAREKAYRNAARNGDRVLRFAKCPKCRRRRGVGAFAGPYVLVFLVLAAAMALLGLLLPGLVHSLDASEIHLFRTWLVPFINVGLALMLFGAAVAEWRGIDRRVRWLER